MRSVIAVLIAACWLSPLNAEPYNDGGPAVIQIHIEGVLQSLPAGAQTKFFQDDATGFIVSPDGLVMTAGHVVPDPSTFEDDTLTIEGRLPQEVPLGVPGGDVGLVASDPAIQLKVVKSSRTPHDVGLFKIENVKQPLKFLRLCDDYHVGEPLTLLGYLGGLKTLATRDGKVAAPAIGATPITMQIPMHYGDSGGPVFNSKGAVIAIGIGQLKIDRERVEVMNLAVLIHNAIPAMSPETKALIGTSYDPLCDKKLAAPSAPDVGEQVNVKQSTGVTLGSGQAKTLTQTFHAPEGKVFSEILVADAMSTSKDISATTADSTISSGGKTLEMTVHTNNTKKNFGGLGSVLESLGWTTQEAQASIGTNVIAEIKPVPNDAVVASDRAGSRLQSFLVSKTLEIHGPTPTRQSYSDKIPAPAGYRFRQVVGVKVASMSHSSRKSGVEASVGAEGSFIQTSYDLESGPVDDPWKAWIDAFITATLEPLNK